jgi:hypothetical protein
VAYSEGPPAWEFFSSIEMVDALTRIATLRREAIRVGRPDIQLALSQIGVELERELNTLATTTAARADEAIKRKLMETRRRPRTDRTRHLEDSIKSVPYPGLGGVKIALVSELDQAVNPSGYGPYWSAIEFGSVEVGNPMTGRTLYGTFTGGGSDPERPRRAYRRDNLGDAMAPHAQFEWYGEDEGKGVIKHEIEGRHFLKRGADEAWAFYAREVRTLDNRYSKRLLDLIAPR